MPFFFARPAATNRQIVFGTDIVQRVEEAVTKTLATYSEQARKLEESTRGSSSQSNVIYFQPDVFVLADGTVAVEKINCPDVGFFLADIEFNGSTTLPRIQEIIRELRKIVCSAIVEHVGRKVILVARDEIFDRKEDLLEIGEVESLRYGLESCGATVEILPVSEVGILPSGSAVVLLNLNYKSSEVATLLDRHGRGELECFPNPYFQQVCQGSTGLPHQTVTGQYRERFLQLAGSAPLKPEGIVDVVNRLDQILIKSGIKDDILYIHLAQEMVPVFRWSLHSWRQFAKRIHREENIGGHIRICGLPVEPNNLLITSPTGPRLHVFRFMCTSPQLP